MRWKPFTILGIGVLTVGYGMNTYHNGQDTLQTLNLKLAARQKTLNTPDAPPPAAVAAIRPTPSLAGAVIAGSIEDGDLKVLETRLKTLRAEKARKEQILNSLVANKGGKALAMNRREKTFHDDGTIKSEVPIVNGRRHGTFTQFSENGVAVKVIEYKNGRMHGLSRDYSDDGKTLLKEIPFRHGRMHGVSKDFDPTTGKLSKEITFENGKMHGPTRDYDSSGKIFKDYQFVDGNMEGLARKYNENGIVIKDWTFMKGKMEGISRSYFESGKVHKEYSMKDNTFHGITRVYDEEGNIIKEHMFRDGKVIAMPKSTNTNGQGE